MSNEPTAKLTREEVWLHALGYALSVGIAWREDANPHGDLEPGESFDYDAACLFVTTIREAISYQ